MRSEMVAGFLAGIVIPFSALAAAMAFLITYMSTGGITPMRALPVGRRFGPG